MYIHIYEKRGFFCLFFSLSSLNAGKCTFGTVSSMLCSGSCELCFNDCGLIPWCRKFFFSIMDLLFIGQNFLSHDFFMTLT